VGQYVSFADEKAKNYFERVNAVSLRNVHLIDVDIHRVNTGKALSFVEEERRTIAGN